MPFPALNISSGTVNIRSTPSTSGAIVGSVAKNATVTVNPVTGNDRWFSVSSGYVAGDFFHMQPTGLPQLITSNFTGTVNVRYEPSTSAGTTSIVFQLYIGQILTKLQDKTGWSQVTCSLGTGWIDNSFVSAYSGTPTVPTLKYGTISGPGYLNVRDAPGGSSIRKLPEGRLVVFESPAVSGYVKVKFRGNTGWVQQSYLGAISDAGISCRLRLAAVGLQEKNAITLRADVQEEEFYGAPLSTPGNIINYCHYTADTLATTAWYDPQNLPMTGNCKEGVKFFLQKNQFFFVSASHKQQIYNLVPDMRPYMNNISTLTAADLSYAPNAGAYVYFRTIPTETSSHVGIVTNVTSSKIYTIEGNVGTNKIVDDRDYDRTGSNYHPDILGFAVPTMS